MFENSSLSRVLGSAMAPYFNDALIRQCGSSDMFMDNVFGSTNLVSEPHYVAWASGSNCNTGVTPSGTGCLTSDANPSAGNMLSTRSIFDQVTSWRSYQEAWAPHVTAAAGQLRAETQPARLLHDAREHLPCERPRDPADQLPDDGEHGVFGADGCLRG